MGKENGKFNKKLSKKEKRSGKNNNHVDDDFIEKFIEETILPTDDDYRYCDNYRWYEEGNKSQKLKYDMLIRKGCCGFYDEWHSINGKKYMIGFNYGH